MSIHYKISKPIVRSLLAYLDLCGHGSKAMCQSFDINYPDIMNGDGLLPSCIYTTLLKAGENITNDPAFGLHLGISAKPERWGVLGYIMTCCHTLHEAIHCQHRYQDLVGSMGSLIVSPRGDTLRMLWDTDFTPLATQAEEAITGWVAFGRWVTDTNLSPSHIYFSHPAPQNTQPYQQFFNCPVEFDAEFNALEINASLLGTPLKKPDKTIKGRLILHAEERLEDIDEPQTFLKVIKRYIKETLPKETPELTDAAAIMELTPRTLQRRLKNKGMHFSAVIEETRNELAFQYLADTKNTMADITFLLGFSEQSAFSRAFKRRTGKSPGEYRKTAFE